MIVICEECSKKYNINPDRLKKETARVTCKNCGHAFVVHKPEAAAPVVGEVVDIEAMLSAVPVEAPVEDAPSFTEDSAAAGPGKDEKRSKSLRLGLTAKFILFLLVPFISIYAASSYYSLVKMDQMNNLARAQTSDIVWGIAKRSLTDKAVSVARQVRQYLYSHPELKNHQFNRDIYFKKIALQKMGVTGETFLYELPGENGVSRMWAHGNAGLVGEDLRQLVQKKGNKLKAFWSIITGIKNGKNSEGFYTWIDKSGMEVEKYMVCAPVSGTPYAVAATTISSEFVYPVKVIEAKAGQLAHQARQVSLAALLTGFLVLGTIILFYGRNLSNRVRHLADVADRICVGQLDTGIRITARDEIGDLGNAIAQMRDSIKVSIKRLQRRRN